MPPPLLPELSRELDSDGVQPYFVWDIPITVGELKRQLAGPDPRLRAQWMARVMREARYPDVWKFLRVDDIVSHWPLIQRHLGRSRRFWEFLLDGWRQDGLIHEPT